MGSGGGAAAAAPSGGAAGGGAADAPVEEEKAEEKAEGKSSDVKIKIGTDVDISSRKGRIGRGYGLWVVRLDAVFLWFASYYFQHTTEMNIPSFQERRSSESLLSPQNLLWHSMNASLIF